MTTKLRGAILRKTQILENKFLEVHPQLVLIPQILQDKLPENSRTGSRTNLDIVLIVSSIVELSQPLKQTPFLSPLPTLELGMFSAVVDTLDVAYVHVLISVPIDFAECLVNEAFASLTHRWLKFITQIITSQLLQFSTKHFKNCVIDRNEQKSIGKNNLQATHI